MFLFVNVFPGNTREMRKMMMHGFNKRRKVRKRTFGHVHPAKSQISLRIRAVT